MSTRVDTHAAALEGRLAALREKHWWIAYERAREAVLRMQDLGAHRTTTSSPSAYWTEELLGFAYLFDPSPLVVEKLRQHCFHITGVKVYDYRTGDGRSHAMLEERLRALEQIGGADLLIPEPRELGGFGFEIDGGLHNVDSLKYSETLMALRRGGALREFLDPSRRTFAWEIGGGYGGLAYAFAHACPNTTYIITDLPELFLFSGTFLQACFPDAKLVFYGDCPVEEIDWGSADFVFLPNYDTAALTPPRVDLTLNTVSFQEMTAAQVDEYSRRAAEVRSTYLYSLNRERSFYNEEIDSVHDIMGRYYRLHEVPMLPTSYVKVFSKPAKPAAKGEGPQNPPPRKDNDYRHMIGWRRTLR